MPDAPVPPGYTTPPGVTLGQPGHTEFFTQRIDGRPFVNCMTYTACSLIEYSGVNVPKDFGMTIREGTGVPVEPHKGISVAQLKRGIRSVLPFVQYNSGLLTDAELLARAREEQSYGLMIDFSKVPAASPLRLYVGKYTGGHAGWISRSRQINGRWQVRWYDPMAGAAHTGRWLGWRHFRGAVYRYDTKVRVMFTQEGQGQMDFPITYAQYLAAEATWAAEREALEQQLDQANAAAAAAGDAAMAKENAEDEAVTLLQQAISKLESA